MSDVVLSLWNLRFVLGFLVVMHIVAWALLAPYEREGA